MEFDAFDTGKIDEYAKQARQSWGDTDAYREFEKKSENRSRNEERELGSQLMAIVGEFGKLKEKPAEDREVQEQVKKLQEFITEHYYTCTREILAGLGQMYAAGGEFTENINAVGGEGAAEFANEAIQVYCRK